MTSIWNLLFKRQPQRQFVRLDAQGLCQAFKRCEQAPSGSGWVEVGEIRLHWLNRALPANARVSPHARLKRVHSALAA
ncbi:hypothetical protein DCO48_02765 [Pseudomonas sp. SDI]|uniref:hypothetical protein n=1 Tax=Pseudomonas sp. SDI TaxID=2170734 RepID=UPI000DE5ED87|nr:hypothetical protein [Pseudomonas sp. SDI]PWB35360.1 hypothetical protein DCO48_02765 [Pseudomonas sp. SDI]